MKIKSKHTFTTNNFPLNLDQFFSWESLNYYYPDLKKICNDSHDRTKNKSILLPHITTQ